VVAVDVSEAKLAFAKDLGATEAVIWQGDAETTARAVRDATGGGVDYAIEATGRPEAMLAAFLSTRRRGAAVLIGISRPDAVVPLPAATVPRMERRVLGSFYGSVRPERDFAAILRLYTEGRLALDRLISHRLPLEDAPAGLELVRTGRAVRAVLDMSPQAVP
jgi:alcohol dehydrogenase